MRALDRAFARAKRAAKAANLPEVETSTSYGTPALRAGSFRMELPCPSRCASAET
jgi:hypothetical protein